jgi:hypothetical protein
MSIVGPPAPDCLNDLGLDPRLFCVSKEVAHALRSGFPVVALESTIITHGLPFPTNYETAIAAERCIRERGALPATVAIVQGVVHVGATEEVVTCCPCLQCIDFNHFCLGNHASGKAWQSCREGAFSLLPALVHTV